MVDGSPVVTRRAAWLLKGVLAIVLSFKHRKTIPRRSATKRRCNRPPDPRVSRWQSSFRSKHRKTITRKSATKRRCNRPPEPRVSRWRRFQQIYYRAEPEWQIQRFFQGVRSTALKKGGGGDSPMTTTLHKNSIHRKLRERFGKSDRKDSVLIVSSVSLGSIPARKVV